jgi:NAD(P)H dehydrogenase (quinone)
MTDSSSINSPKHAVILCHPAADSFNAAVAKRYCDTVAGLGHQFVLRDLYRIGFDPVFKEGEQPSAAGFSPATDVAAELAMLDDIDVLVLVYPIWFAMPPAMMKGYVDRVLGAGFSFHAVHDRTGNHALSGKHLVSFTSSGTSVPWLEEQGAWVSLRNLFDNYLKNAFSMRSVEHVHFGSIVEGLKKRFVDENLYQVEQAARRIGGTIEAERALPTPAGRKEAETRQG